MLILYTCNGVCNNLIVYFYEFNKTKVLIIAIESTMFWTTSNVMESFKFFQQQTNLYFSEKDSPVEKEAGHVLLLEGEEGLRHFILWTVDSEADKKNPAITWQKFRIQL